MLPGTAPIRRKHSLAWANSRLNPKENARILIVTVSLIEHAAIAHALNVAQRVVAVSTPGGCRLFGFVFRAHLCSESRLLCNGRGGPVREREWESHSVALSRGIISPAPIPTLILKPCDCGHPECAAIIVAMTDLQLLPMEEDPEKLACIVYLPLELYSEAAKGPVRRPHPPSSQTRNMKLGGGNGLSAAAPAARHSRSGWPSTL
jgi:hypothetical protein